MLLLFIAQPGLTAGMPDDLTGLWSAKRRFGPDVQGPLIIERSGASYRADIAGRIVPVRREGQELVFDLPGDQGSFRGKFSGATVITGHWIRPPTAANFARYASPAVLRSDKANRWVGTVDPLKDSFTFYLLLKRTPDGALSALLRNPERDFGSQQRVERLEREGDKLRLVGKRNGKDREVASGTYDADSKTMTLYFASRGGSFDFTREGDESDFYPRGKHPAPYAYHPPLAFDDGWAVGSLEQAGISRPGMESFVQKMLDTPMDSPGAVQLHAVLVARHGKLVLEEYFHGQTREQLHESRSAGKSITSVIVGAAMQAGAPLSLSSPVYQVMNGGAFPAGLDPQKRSITLENLLTMAPGYFCDDENGDAPGNEDTMTDQTEEPDYYRYILKVPLDAHPGERAVYCSAVANLALGMVGRATREFPLYTFDRLVAGPLRIRRYAWFLDPAGNPYGGGSVQLLPRDYAKFGQLMLNGGSWEGHRIISGDYARRATSPLYHLAGITYGYFWWSEEFPYKDRKVQAFMALGAGGQIITVVPELDLVVTFLAGNYSSRAAIDLGHNYVPRYILPAVREAGDDPNAPVVEGSYTSPYGHSDLRGRVTGR